MTGEKTKKCIHGFSLICAPFPIDLVHGLSSGFDGFFYNFETRQATELGFPSGPCFLFLMRMGWDMITIPIEQFRLSICVVDEQYAVTGSIPPALSR